CGRSASRGPTRRHRREFAVRSRGPPPPRRGRARGAPAVPRRPHDGAGRRRAARRPPPRCRARRADPRRLRRRRRAADPPRRARAGGKPPRLAGLGRAAGGPAESAAADASRRKLDLAEDTARRLGLDGIRAVVADLTRPDAPLAPAYDRVLLDAPCSGLGVLRRHPEGKWRRREDEIAALAALQTRLLDALAPRVRPGGILVYSVCTFTDEEGPRQVERFLAEHPDFAPALPPPEPGVEWAPFLDAPSATFRSWPHRHGTDAFFAARLARQPYTPA